MTIYRNTTRIAALVVLAVAVAGCASFANRAQQTATVSAALIKLDRSHEEARATLSGLRSRFTDGEWSTLESADRSLEAVRTTVRDMLDRGNLVEVLGDAERVWILYRVAREAYLGARHVVEHRLGSLPTEIQLRLTAYDFEARGLDDNLKALLTSDSGVDLSKALGDALTIGATAAKLIALL